MRPKIHHITADQMGYLSIRLNKIEAYLLHLREARIVERNETELAIIEDIKDMLTEVENQ